MDDDQIVGLYWARNEKAIEESSTKYGGYCSSIAYNILNNLPETEECVNDTWMNAWNAMPPHRPVVLATFLGKLTRNLAFNLYKRLHRDKRGGGTFALVLDELSECVSGRDNPEQEWQVSELTQEINRFLDTLPQGKQNLFILRYWYADEVKTIARKTGLSEDNICVSLNRIRKQLKDYLTSRGYDI